MRSFLYKILLILSLFIMLFCFVSCGESKGNNSSGDKTSVGDYSSNISGEHNNSWSSTIADSNQESQSEQSAESISTQENQSEQSADYTNSADYSAGVQSASVDDSGGSSIINSGEDEEYCSVTFYKEDGITEYSSVKMKLNDRFSFPDDHPLDETKRKAFIGWGLFNGESFEETPYDINADGANIVTKSLKFKALYGEYQYTPVSP